MNGVPTRTEPSRWGARAALRLLRRATLRLQRAGAGAWARLVLWSEGVQVARGVQLLGVPIVARAEGSRIALGEDVVLCSRSDDTALGVAHPVLLRTLAAGASIEIGADSGLSGSTICAALSVRIGRRCLLGADTLIVDTDFHPLARAHRRHNADAAAVGAAPVVLGDEVFVGARACILKGVTVGDGAVIGCAAVVTHDVPPNSVVAGNPARVIGRLPDATG